MLTIRLCARCKEYRAVAFSQNCRLHATAEEVRTSDEFHEKPFEEQLAYWMTVPLNDQ